jgi:hypothetical protein
MPEVSPPALTVVFGDLRAAGAPKEVLAACVLECLDEFGMHGALLFGLDFT